MSKSLEISFCKLCYHCGRIGDFDGCCYNKKFLAFEDQDDLAEIPGWCPLPDYNEDKQ